MCIKLQKKKTVVGRISGMLSSGVGLASAAFGKMTGETKRTKSSELPNYFQ